nr:MAG TPA: distal tail protein [Caudoviricetes sp.]
MQDYFIWNGTDCRDYGIHVTEQPPITIPAERSTQTNVPGRPGSLTHLEGEDVYDDLLLTAICFISDPAQIPAIAAWLKGSGTVTFANRTGGYYKARIANQIPFEKVLRGNPHCAFSVNFRCFPFWYQEDAASITVNTSGTIVTNPGSVYAEPILTVYGSGDITLMVGSTIVELEDISGSILLDCALKEAYLGNALMNDHMTGEFPVLKPGANAVSWSGTVTKVEIKPNWRFL